MKRWGIFVLLFIFLLSGCKKEASRAETTVFAMDTVMHFSVTGPEPEKALEEVTSLVEKLEEQWSASSPDSVISALNRGVEPEDAAQKAVVEKALALSRRTGGTFDPRLYAVTEAWGFPTKVFRIPSEEEISAARKQEKWDLGAAIKGYAGQEAAALLQKRGCSGILNLGGNVQTVGEKADGTPWRVGIQNPQGGDYLGVLSVTGTKSVVTSGDYQRYFERDGVRYHHILDPETGAPARSGLQAVTVVCADGMTADALSTALFVLGLEKGTALWRESTDFEAVFLTTEGQLYVTEGLALSDCPQGFEVIKR